MAAEVSRQIKTEVKSGGDPITRDFLGGGFGVESKELDLDLHVPVGWEKRLDLKSGKVYIQRCIQQSDQKHKTPTNQTLPSSKNKDITIPPYLSSPKPKTTLNLFESTNPNLPSSPLGNYNSATYQSVCTLDRVKSALDRAWKVPSSSKKRPSPSNSASSSINNNDDLNTNSSPLGRNLENPNLVAGACPCCLLYVLIPESNPKCPKCNTAIPLHVMSKKPKIDLNMSI